MLWWYWYQDQTQHYVVRGSNLKKNAENLSFELEFLFFPWVWSFFQLEFFFAWPKKAWRTYTFSKFSKLTSPEWASVLFLQINNLQKNTVEHLFGGKIGYLENFHQIEFLHGPQKNHSLLLQISTRSKFPLKSGLYCTKNCNCLHISF